MRWPIATSTNAALLAFTAFFSGAVHAQVPTPGQVGDTLKKPPELKLPQTAPAVQQQRQTPSEPAAGRKISVSRFVFSGNTVYKTEQLESLLATYLNRPIALMDIYAAADTVAEFYVRNGYSLASVSVPAQKVTEGTVRLEVSEGRLNQILVEGNHRYQADHVRDYLGNVQTGTLYRGDELEAGMRGLNDLPGVSAKAVVKPGDLYGTSDLVIKVSEDPVNGSMLVDNYGRKQIGEFRFATLMQLNNPSGVEDQLQVLGLRSDQGLLNYYYLAYSVPVDFSGTRLSMNYGHANFGVADLPVTGRNDSGKLMLERGLFRSRATTAKINAGLSRTVANTDFSGLPLNATSITLFEIGGTYNHTYETQAVTQVTSSIATTFKKQDPAALAPAPGETVHGEQRLRWELDIQHLQPIHHRISLLARLNAVYSPDALVDSQKYSIGGPQNVRGYPASEARGDRGVFGSVTLARPFALGPVNMSGRVFVDSGRVYSIDSPADTSLTSVGIGMDGQFDRLSMKLDWSFPRDGKVSSDGRDNSRLFGSFAVGF